MKKQSTPKLLIGDTEYEMSKEYIEGAIAMRMQTPYLCNPYKDNSEKHNAWNYGHQNESACEHIRMGCDVLLNAGSYEYWNDDPDVPRDEYGVIKDWYNKKLNAIKSIDDTTKKTNPEKSRLADLTGKLLASRDSSKLLYEWVKTDVISYRHFKELLGLFNKNGINEVDMFFPSVPKKTGKRI